MAQVMMGLVLPWNEDGPDTAVECSVTYNMPQHDVPSDWRTEARAAAKLYGWNLTEADLISIRSFLEFRIRENHESFIGLSCRNVSLPGGTVLLENRESKCPLCLIWEETRDK